jgi:methylglutamate dehydrogenase subunit C
MMASAMRTYLHRFGVTVGKRVVLFTATDDGWKTALDLSSAGVSVEAIVDVRADVNTGLLARARRMGARILLDSRVTDVRGAHAVRTVDVRDRSGSRVRLDADVLAVSGGWNPNLSLTTHLGGRPRWSAEVSAFIPGDSIRGMTVVGAAGGSFAVSDALREGTAAGAQAAEASGYDAPHRSAPRADDEQSGIAPFWYVADSTRKAFVDFQHDVTPDDVVLAAREGYRSVELLKRYTTLGMGTDQGKTSNVNGLAILASLTDRTIPQVGTTVFRPPYTPVAIGALAGHHRGRNFAPTRFTSSHAWAVAKGATFVEAGQWLRAQWFAAPGETDWRHTVAREVKTVRSGVGVCDVSTLGKIGIQGRDAGVFLDRIYINAFSSVPVGKVRYGVMLREDGMVFDDGTSARLAADHYVMTTTTINAGKVMQHLEYARQVLWPELDVQIVSVTEQWAQYAIAGPHSRRLVQTLLGDALDVANEAFPYLACAEMTWQGIPARLFRVSFSGELGYELAVPARRGEATLRAIMDAGKEWGVVPYGTEALGVMRIEKGHVAGNELNGQTSAHDLGFGRMMSTKKDFIGRVLAGRPGLTDPERPALVGIKPVDPRARLHAGAHFLVRGATPSLDNDQGHVTSVAYSPSLESWIGLGLLARGPRRHGERIRAYDPVRNGDVEVQVVAPTFVDPEGARLRA